MPASLPPAAPDHPSRAGALRRRHGLRAAVGLLLAAGLAAWGHAPLAALAAALAVSLAALAAWAPTPWLRTLDVRVARLAEGVGVGLSWLVLAPIFWLFVTPLGVLTRRGSRDPLGRGRGRETYWSARREGSDDTAHPY